jgi:hypothetical protein
MLCRFLFASLMLACCARTTAADLRADCDRDQIAAHARLEFEIYGPLSVDAEYFGFIFYDGARLQSAVVRSRRCASRECVIHVDEAGRMIPVGARVLGEWHTHPHGGSPELSRNDVRGAYRNRHVSCYTAFYSDPFGGIFAWDPARPSVRTAMATRQLVGEYGTRLSALAAGLARR